MAARRANGGGVATLGVAALLATALLLDAASPAAGDASNFGLCIRNCVQCKKMFGAFFEGKLCGEYCLKTKGELIPDCEDYGSIAPFLNKNE